MSESGNYNMGFGYGLQRIIDAQQTFMRAGLPVFLRLRNFPDPQNQEWAQFGFAITPSGNVPTGVTDVEIIPPPFVSVLSEQNIAKSNGKFRFGAKYFLISDTFVETQAADMGIKRPSTLWRNPLVVGLVTDNVLYSIENITNEQLAGKTITWQLTCNGNEVK